MKDEIVENCRSAVDLLDKALRLRLEVLNCRHAGRSDVNIQCIKLQVICNFRVQMSKDRCFINGIDRKKYKASRIHCIEKASKKVWT